MIFRGWANWRTPVGGRSEFHSLFERALFHVAYEIRSNTTRYGPVDLLQTNVETLDSYPVGVCGREFSVGPRITSLAFARILPQTAGCTRTRLLNTTAPKANPHETAKQTRYPANS